MTYKEALLKHLFGLFDRAQDVRMKAMFAMLKRQLEAISEEQAREIVLQATQIIKKIEADVKPITINDKVSPSAKK